MELKRFRQELQELQKKINLSNSSNMAEFAPCLKELYNNVKKSFNDEKDKIYWLTRELEEVRSSGHKLGLQMSQCEDRLLEIEGVVGVKTEEEYDQLVI